MDMNDITEKTKIKHVSDYLRAIEKCRNLFADEDIVVFRGEDQIFSSACQPNLFRNRMLDHNSYFEKNVLDEMTADQWTQKESYLMKAVDAQHGGFPSRLLDVSYNALIALYFAVTPYYTKPITADDGEDGIVYMFDFERMYCATGQNMEELYESIVQRNIPWLVKSKAFSLNHKLIDHVKANDRIKAQQGAFILFQGDEFVPVSEYNIEKIIIHRDSKKVIREELNRFFGIHTGFVYPEGTNCVNEIINKSKKLNAKKFTFENEIYLLKDSLMKFIQFQTNSINEKSTQLTPTEVRKLEERYCLYGQGIKELLKQEHQANGVLPKDTVLQQFVAIYKKGLFDLNQCMARFQDHEVQLSIKDLDITEPKAEHVKKELGEEKIKEMMVS